MNSARLIREITRRPLFRLEVSSLNRGRVVLNGDWSSLVTGKNIQSDVCYLSFSRDLVIDAVKPSLLVNSNSCVRGPRFEANIETLSREFNPFDDTNTILATMFDANDRFNEMIRDTELDIPHTRAFTIKNPNATCLNRELRFEKVVRSSNGSPDSVRILRSKNHQSQPQTTFQRIQSPLVEEGKRLPIS